MLSTLAHYELLASFIFPEMRWGDLPKGTEKEECCVPAVMDALGTLTQRQALDFYA